MLLTKTQVCTKCNVEKLLGEFYLTGYEQKDGTLSRKKICSECDNKKPRPDKKEYVQRKDVVQRKRTRDSKEEEGDYIDHSRIDFAFKDEYILNRRTR